MSTSASRASAAIEERASSPRSSSADCGPSLYFRIADDSDSERGNLEERPVSFVTYGRDDETDNWRSVVARGTLERTTNEDIALEALEGLERVTINLVDIFDEPTSEVSFSFFRLVPDTLTGRKEEPRGP